MAMVLLVLGLVYIVLLGITMANTCKRMFKSDNSISMKVFKSFYAFILTQIVLTDALYWAYFFKIIDSSFEQDMFGLGSQVALVFLPTILMMLNYSLLYFQLER